MADFSALTHAWVELLMKTDSRHVALGPRTTEAVTVLVVAARATVNSKTLLELSSGSDTLRSVAVPL